MPYVNGVTPANEAPVEGKKSVDKEIFRQMIVQNINGFFNPEKSAAKPEPQAAINDEMALRNTIRFIN